MPRQFISRKLNSMSMQDKNKESYIFTDTQIENFAGLYNVLKRVHDRLIGEGYVIKNGQIVPPQNLHKPPLS